MARLGGYLGLQISSAAAQQSLHTRALSAEPFTAELSQQRPRNSRALHSGLRPRACVSSSLPVGVASSLSFVSTAASRGFMNIARPFCICARATFNYASRLSLGWGLLGAGRRTWSGLSRQSSLVVRGRRVRCSSPTVSGARVHI